MITGLRTYPRAVRDEDDDPREAPPTVVGATAAGVAPLPFLAVYAVLFISHGSFHPVVPPDITTTKHGELVAGFIALGLFIVEALSVLWLMNGRRRWLFVLTQAATLAAVRVLHLRPHHRVTDHSDPAARHVGHRARARAAAAVGGLRPTAGPTAAVRALGHRRLSYSQ